MSKFQLEILLVGIASLMVQSKTCLGSFSQIINQSEVYSTTYCQIIDDYITGYRILEIRSEVEFSLNTESAITSSDGNNYFIAFHCVKILNLSCESVVTITLYEMHLKCNPKDITNLKFEPSERFNVVIRYEVDFDSPVLFCYGKDDLKHNSPLTSIALYYGSIKAQNFELGVLILLIVMIGLVFWKKRAQPDLNEEEDSHPSAYLHSGAVMSLLNSMASHIASTDKCLICFRLLNPNWKRDTINQFTNSNIFLTLFRCGHFYHTNCLGKRDIEICLICRCDKEDYIRPCFQYYNKVTTDDLVKLVYSFDQIYSTNEINQYSKSIACISLIDAFRKHNLELSSCEWLLKSNGHSKQSSLKGLKADSGYKAVYELNRRSSIDIKSSNE